jgi:hypothetical protein
VIHPVLAAWPLALSIAIMSEAPSRPTGAIASAPAFLDLVRQATEKYHDRARAVADGYRPIGRDFPGMGEHWIHIGLLFDGAYDPAHPEFLTYVAVNGSPRLLGVAYGLPLLPGESPPEEPAGQGAWHDHVGTLDEETLRPHHHVGGHGIAEPRIAMVHAWVWLSNPAGLFAADNWAIPFARLGLRPETAPSAASAKALSLLSGGDSYLAAVLANTGPPSLAQARSVNATLARSRARVAALVTGLPDGTLATADLEALSTIWHELWQDVDHALPEARDGLGALPIR